MDFFASDQKLAPQKGDLLLSEPFLPDPNFERTVILICEHDDNGTFGLVLNKESQVFIGDVMDELTALITKPFIGGPVEQDTLHFLHRDQSLGASSRQLLDGVFWGGAFEELATRINTKSLSAQDIRFFLGYSGWSPGQLAEEIQANAWIIFKQPTAEMIFDWDNHQLWKACLQYMGGKFRLISNYPKDPRLN